MEENINWKELSIILGLKENHNELNKILSDKNELSFLGAVSNILFSDKLNDLYENLDKKNGSNEMIENFIKKAEIEEIGPVKLELYNDSNFIESIKGNNTLLHLPEINYTEKYLSKLQKDFIKEEKEVIEPIEIKAPNIDKKANNNKNHQKQKKLNEKKNKAEEEKENNKIEKKTEPQEKDEEDIKEISEKTEKEMIDGQKEQNHEFEEDEKIDDKKNNGSNQSQNYRRPFNKKYNKNKGHKDYRKNVNARKHKNY